MSFRHRPSGQGPDSSLGPGGRGFTLVAAASPDGGRGRGGALPPRHDRRPELAPQPHGRRRRPAVHPGFRDVLEIAGATAAIPTTSSGQPAPLVPRRLRLPVTERVRAGGTIDDRHSSKTTSRAALDLFASEGVTSVAVAFMNAYANPAHELAAEGLLRELGFAGEISLSHRVSGEYREYERTSTTVIDAYVRPPMGAYLRPLEAAGGGRLRANGDRHPLRRRRHDVRRGRGSPIRDDHVRPGCRRRRGRRALPRARDLGDYHRRRRRHELRHMPRHRRPGAAHVPGRGRGLPVQTPWVDVRSIGAGGGSIAHVDVGGLLRVGPASAGAEPGPACYGRGGALPTVTDAAFLLGMLGEGSSRAGSASTSEAARAALAPLAETPRCDVEEVARGVITIAPPTWPTRSARSQSSGPGSARAALMPSAAPARSSGRCSHGSSRSGEIVVPPYAGNFSAWGLLGQDLVRSPASCGAAARKASGGQPRVARTLRSARRALVGGPGTEREAARHAVRGPGPHADDRGLV